MFKINVEIQQDGIIDQSQFDFANPIIVEKRNGSLHVPTGESSKECTVVVVSTSPSSLEDAVVTKKNLLDESVTTDIIAVASDGDNTNG